MTNLLTQTVKAKQPVFFGMRMHAKGDLIEMPAKLAQQLIQAGVVEFQPNVLVMPPAKKEQKAVRQAPETTALR